MNKGKGFTLIELVIVIVIIGILSAVALPEFYGIKEEATQARLDAVKSNIETTLTMVQAKLILHGLDGASVSSMDDENVAKWLAPACGMGAMCSFNYGHPTATEENFKHLMPDLKAKEWVLNDEEEGVLYIYYKGGTKDKCSIVYTPDNKKAAYTLTVNKCLD